MTFVKFAALTVAVGAIVAAVAPAEAINRVSLSNPTNYCQTALPVFDGNVRKRPVSVQNEGNSNAFITCSWGIEVIDGTESTGISSAEVWFHSTAAGSVTCTGVAGWNGVQAQSVKTLTLPGGGQSDEAMIWTPADFPNGQMGTGLFSVSCNLQPGQGIDDSYITYDDGEVTPA
jgi:hypothetical protein